jgi:beta-1,4-mannosyl-glycoprotein beta-1,4-N-acetylglucosaminyltransferase
MFFDELDLLEIRLEETFDIVDRFIISESLYTHSGNEKPLFFETNKDRYNKYLPKITHVVYESKPNSNSWYNENNQRRSLGYAMNQSVLNDHDLIIISDLDEIINRNTLSSIVANIDHDLLPITLCHTMYTGKINYKVIDPAWCQNWRGACIINGKLLREKEYDLHFFRHYKDSFNYLENAKNWHFTSVGNEDNIRHKLISYAHTETNTHDNLYNIKNRLLDVKDPMLSRDYKLEKTIIDDSFPKAIIENIDKYKTLIG